MADFDLLLEAEKRGILPEDKVPILAEARKRGLVTDSKPSKSIPGRFLNAAKNIPGDFGQAVGGMAKAAMHPIETIKNLGSLGVGGMQMGLDQIFPHPKEETSHQQMFRKGIMEPIQGYIKDPSKLADYAEEHPIQALMNLSPALKGAGAAAKLGGLTRTGNVLADIGKYTSLPTMGVPTAVRKGLDFKGVSSNKLMEKTVKVPPASLSHAEKKRVSETMLREKTPVGAGPFSKMGSTIKELDDNITKVLDSVSDKRLGVGSEIDVSRAVSGLNALEKSYSNRIKPPEYTEAVKNLKQDILSHEYVKRATSVQQTGMGFDPQAGPPHPINNPTYSTYSQISTPSGRMSLSDAHSLKKGIYQDITEFYHKGEKPLTGKVGIQNESAALAASKVAHELKEQILNHPDVPREIRKMLSREADLVNARRWVERAINREGNIDLMSLSGMIFGQLVDKGLPATVAYKLTRMAPVQSRLAIVLRHGLEGSEITGMKTGKYMPGIPRISRTAGQGLFQAQQDVPNERQ